MKKEAYYFSHDANARNDVKMIRLRRSLGLEGYAIYFCLIEILREQAGYKLPLSSVPDIAFELHTSDEKVKVVINSFDLFIVEENHFFSARLLQSMDQYNEVKAKLVEAGRKGGLSRASASLEHRSSIKVKEINKRKQKQGDLPNGIFKDPDAAQHNEIIGEDHNGNPIRKKVRRPNAPPNADESGMVW